MSPREQANAVAAYRANVPRKPGCADCGAGSMACLLHALELALVTSDAMTDAFREQVFKMVACEQALRSVMDLVEAAADGMDERQSVSGDILRDLFLQVQAQAREVLR